MVEIDDAYRGRWLLNHMRLERVHPGEWTCWLTLDMICFRSKTTSPVELLDELIQRFPLAEDDNGPSDLDIDPHRNPNDPSFQT